MISAAARSRAQDLMEGLAARRILRDPLAVVFAHPDDETIALGPMLKYLPACRFIHVTDGAPSNLRDAHANGYRSGAEYAAARSAELGRALDLVGVGHDRRHAFAIADQQAYQHLPTMAAALGAMFETHGISAVFTHPYEGGHLDHDACALAVSLACTRLERRGLTPPVVLECAFYHQNEHGLVTQRFPDDEEEETVIPLDQGETQIRDQMIAAHASQSAMLGLFPEPSIRLRCAPDYDFRRLPNRGRIFYDRFIQDVTPAMWLEAVRDAYAWLDSPEVQ